MKRIRGFCLLFCLSVFFSMFFMLFCRNERVIDGNLHNSTKIRYEIVDNQNRYDVRFYNDENRHIQIRYKYYNALEEKWRVSGIIIIPPKSSEIMTAGDIGHIEVWTELNIEEVSYLDFLLYYVKLFFMGKGFL